MTTNSEKLAMLRAYGYVVGERDPKLNRKFPGKFMVCENPEEAPPEGTEDGSNGPWCIVGDDLDALIDQAYAVLQEIVT